MGQLKKVTIVNRAASARQVRLFFAHDFHIYGNEIGDTAVYRPEVKGVLHYKMERYFLTGAYAHGAYGVDAFATGNKELRTFEGTWRDAEDGVLSGNPIAQGSVDSVVGVHLQVPANSSEICYYWICVGKNWEEVKELNQLVQLKGAENLLVRTRNYWHLWVHKENSNYSLLPPRVARLYQRSLLICRTHIDNCGSIIAANDSDVVDYNRDTYSYMWPRDAALVAYALDLAGYYNVTRTFFAFCAKIIDREGYLLHKYTPSGAIASSWHPWEKDHKAQLPIQEDETALVIWALWQHYLRDRDVEFIKPLYRVLIKRAANFMLRYRDEKSGLPLPSYDLWEERQGVLTFTTATVYGGLTAAANFAEAFGETQLAHTYRAAATQMREGMDRFLYSEKEGRFLRMITFSEAGAVEEDGTIDASLYALFAFGAYSATDPKVKSTMEQVRAKLWCSGPAGGITRYENDPYYRTDANAQGNPWFVTTLWLAQYYIAIAQSKGELRPALELLEWAVERALPSGVLAEQIDPQTNAPLSVSPLTWSHATYIMVVKEYLNKLIGLEKCPSCGQGKFLKYFLL